MSMPFWILPEVEKATTSSLVKSGKFLFRGKVIPDYEDAISIATIRRFLSEPLANIIEDALAGLAHKSCPHCQRYIGLDQYIGSDDIEQWIRANVKLEEV